MKRTFKKLALCLVLGTLAISCQKEDFIETQTLAPYNAEYTVHYAVDDIMYQETIAGDESWSEFMSRMLALAEQGYQIRIFNENARFNTATSAKTVVTYSTSDKDEANAWCLRMKGAGYNVTITYNDKEKMYECIAII